MKMTKTLITRAVFAAVVVSPAHAISAQYRAQLERSGCTQETDGNGCDIHKTAAQNGISRHTVNARKDAAEQRKREAKADAARGMQPFVGVWKIYQPNGQNTGTLVVKANSVTMSGVDAQGYNVNGNILDVYLDGMHFVLGKNKKGTWTNDSINANGYLTR